MCASVAAVAAIPACRLVPRLVSHRWFRPLAEDARRLNAAWPYHTNLFSFFFFFCLCA
jgi:hypothetical protein